MRCGYFYKQSLFAILCTWTAAAVTAPVPRPPLIEPSTEQTVTQPLPLSYQSLAQIDELVSLGLPALALNLVEQEQPKWPPYSPDWYSYERKRVELLAATQQWQPLIDRTRSLLTKARDGYEITPQIRRWFITRQIIAHLQLNQPALALQHVREVIWDDNHDDVDSGVMALWRRLVVRAYLALGNDKDAQRALLRYQQDYPNSNHDWRLLQARVLLKTGSPDEVLSLLSQADTDIEQALYLIAAVRAKPAKAMHYAQQAEDRLGDKELARDAFWAFSYVRFEAARLSGNLQQTITALEQLLALGQVPYVLGEEFAVDADLLWKNYERLGIQTGNRYNLLVGDDSAWYSKAGDIQPSSPVAARGMYAVLALYARDAEKRMHAHDELVALLAVQDNGLEVVSQLYLKSSRIESLDGLSAEARYRLVDYALTTGQLSAAARLMASLPEPPADQDPFNWRLRKARVLILEGDYEAGVAVLTKAITGVEQLDPAQLDQYLQVLFDLQAVKQHEAALKLFDLIKEEWLDDKMERELFFWKAESNVALGKHAQAALLYLRSAKMVDATMTDLWAHSARFRAARELVRAGLFDDAQTMFNDLMAITADDTRKAIIKQELQNIQLLRNAGRGQ